MLKFDVSSKREVVKQAGSREKRAKVKVENSLFHHFYAKSVTP